MTASEVELLRSRLGGELVETHISWVILANKEAIKIKKPVTYSFLDFSTLEARKHFCDEEFSLNSRLTNIYKEVRPLTMEDGNPGFSGKGEVIDYAVVMERQKDSDRLDVRLHESRITPEQITKLADTLANFHLKCEPLSEKEDPKFIEKRFRDVLAVRDWVSDEMGESRAAILDRAIAFHETYITNHYSNFQKRIELGFKRDLHGDLHTQNIFIGDEAVIFDCIEFDDRYRKIDVISEIAFLVMDLQYHERHDLAETFLKRYQERFTVMNNSSDKELFRYYLAYRANVKVKVNGLKAMNSKPFTDISELKNTVSDYLDLLDKYISS